MSASPVDLLLSKLPDAKRSRGGWKARCPAHDDRRPSLSVLHGDNGGAVLHCHAGCEPKAVVAALGLTMADLMPPRSEPAGVKPKTNSKPRIVATYDYRGEAGELLFQVVRREPKDFRQRRPEPSGEWNWSVKGVRVIPYRLPELLAKPTRPVIVVEGEKDVDNLADIGVLATCNAGGSGKWTAEHAEFLRDRRVIVLADNDDPGRNHADQVATTLHGTAKWVRRVELPDLPPKGDASDWIAAGGTKDQLKQLVESTPVWRPTAATRPWLSMVPFDMLNLPNTRLS
jgi:hypothetical protein